MYLAGHDMWVKMAPMPEPRFRFDAAYANGFVYVFGGGWGLYPLNPMGCLEGRVAAWMLRCCLCRSQPAAKTPLRQAHRFHHYHCLNLHCLPHCAGDTSSICTTAPGSTEGPTCIVRGATQTAFKYLDVSYPGAHL
jgi:hypothetical protein